MPELPDLAVIAKNLETRLKDNEIKTLTLFISKKSNVAEEELQNALIGYRLQSFYREGKELRLSFTSGKTLGLHLMLHGELRLLDNDEEVKFPILKLQFKNGNTLVLTDWQKQATPTLNPAESNVPDALALEYEPFKQMLSKKKTDIKSVLMDQKIIRGIGNAYADEILYESGISPLSAANAIPTTAVKKLFTSIGFVLNDAITKISEADPDRVTGENRDFMRIHLPKTKETMNGEEIFIDKKGSRKTYYTNKQELFT